MVYVLMMCSTGVLSTVLSTLPWMKRLTVHATGDEEVAGDEETAGDEEAAGQWEFKRGIRSQDGDFERRERVDSHGRISGRGGESTEQRRNRHNDE